jgi:hypothetical protein
MRRAFAHELWLEMAPEADLQAPGAAVTVALCGGWEHDPPCPIAPHHSHASRAGRRVTVRVLFAAQPQQEAQARRLIEQAGRSGGQAGPGGTTTTWQFVRAAPADVVPEEEAHAQRLVNAPSP